MEVGGVMMEARKLTLYFFLSYCKYSPSHHYHHHNHRHRRRRKPEKRAGNAAHSWTPAAFIHSSTSKKQFPKLSQEEELQLELEEEEEEEEDNYHDLYHHHDHDQPDSPSPINSPIDYSSSTYFVKQEACTGTGTGRGTGAGVAAVPADDGEGEKAEKAKRIPSSSLIGCFCLRRLRRVSHSSSTLHVVADSVLKRGIAGQSIDKSNQLPAGSDIAPVWKRIVNAAAVSATSDHAQPASPDRASRDNMVIARRGGSITGSVAAMGTNRRSALRSGRMKKWKPGLEMIREDKLAVVMTEAMVAGGGNKQQRELKKVLAKPTQQQYYSWYSYQRKSMLAKSSYNKINWLHDGRSPLHSNNPLTFMF